MSEKYKTLVVDYPFSLGGIDFPAMLLSGSNIMCTINYENLDSNEVSVALHQSIDGISWGLVPDSTVLLSKDFTSHTWNVRGLVRDAYIRVSLSTSVSPSGVVNNIKLLSNE